MTRYHNIERVPGEPHEYTGYGRESTFKISQTNKGIDHSTGKVKIGKGWTAVGANEVKCTMTLKALSKWLETPVIHRVERLCHD